MVGEEEPRCKSINIKLNGYARLQSIAADVDRTLGIWRPELALIEGYSFPVHRNVDSFITGVECGTVIRQILYQKRLSWIEIPPKTLKKWTTGNGNADKPQMAEAVKERWNFRSDNTDLVDAFALAQMGQLGLEELNKIPGVKVVKLF